MFEDYIPVWGRVLVKPVDIAETDELLASAEAAGIQIISASRDQEQNAQNEGILVKAGGDCFVNWKGRIPEEGDRVLYNKYAGFILKDGEHRVINDTDILCVIGE